MKINPISIYQPNYNSSKINQARIQKPVSQQQTPSFKGNAGAAWGVFGGFLAGAGITALTIATGGLAGVVAAVGSAGATTLLGGAACTHAGGIIGSIIEEKSK